MGGAVAHAETQLQTRERAHLALQAPPAHQQPRFADGRTRGSCGCGIPRPGPTSVAGGRPGAVAAARLSRLSALTRLQSPDGAPAAEFLTPGTVSRPSFVGLAAGFVSGQHHSRV